MTRSEPITDIHVHVLPGLDDGPADIEESQALLDSLLASGVNRVFCTSHYGSPSFQVTYEDLETAYHQLPLNNAFFSSISLSCAAEIRLSPLLVEDLKTSRVPTLGKTRYVLVEFPANEISEQNMALVYELRVRGYLPIMAHPERNLAVQRRTGLIEELIDAGLLLQLTADCFLKTNREQLTRDKLAWRILEQGQASFIASDAHNTTSRPPVLRRAYEAIAVKSGDEVVRQLMDNANAVWDDTEVHPVPAVKVKKRLLGLF